MKNDYLVVFVTAKNKNEASRISKGLLANKLIACANILSPVQSLFWWQGKIESSSEVLLILKTKKNLFKKVESQIKELHSYQTPEILALPVLVGSKDYLAWIDASVN